MTKRCDFFANHYRSNFVSELIPRQLCARSIVICSAFAAENHATIGINDIGNSCAFPTCIQNVCSGARNILTVFKQASFAVNGVDTVFRDTVNEIISRIFYINIALFIIAVRVEIHRDAIAGNEAVVNDVRLINTVFIKGVNNLIDNVCAGKLYTVYIVRGMICIPTVCNNNTVNISLAVGINAIEQFSAIYASKFAISINFILMTKRRNGSAPVKYCTTTSSGITIMTFFCLGYARTACAEYAANIALFSTSSSLILCFSCRMEMPTALIILKEVFLLLINSQLTPPTADLSLGINLDLVTGEHLGSAIGKFNKTCQRINNDIVIMSYKFFPAFVRVVHTVFVQIVVTAAGRKISRICLFLELPSLNRDGNKRLFTSRFYVTGTFNCNIRNIFFRNIGGIGCGETIQSNHVI